MKAAVVSSFDRPPQYGEFEEPKEGASGQVVVSVRAAALSQLTRALASGKHYSAASSRKLPLVPGFDGVGTLPDGRRVYFAFPSPDSVYGSMAERTVMSENHCIPVPEGVSDAEAAAIANPGMSAWAALIERAKLQAGETVLINGATGASGRLGVKIAKLVGAGRVIATGRNRAVLGALLEGGGADAVIELDQSPETLAADFKRHVETGVDVVLDYLWGPPAERLLQAISGYTVKPVRFVQIGSMAGQTAVVPAAALRNSKLELVGSGLGSLSTEALLRSIAGVLQACGEGKLSIDYQQGDRAPGGSCPGVAVGGSSLGGGGNDLSTVLGETLDNIVSFEVVLANGSIVEASD